MPDVDVLDALAQDGYRMGSCSVVPYRPDQPQIFGRHLIPRLYDLCVESHILKPLFCGMLNLNSDAICSYLTTRPIILLCVDDSTSKDRLPDGRAIAGFAFPTSFVGPSVTENGPQLTGQRSALAGYGYFRCWWGTPELEVLGMLGLAYLFTKYRLVNLHAQSYSTNTLSTRFIARFGFRQTGLLPKFLAQRNRDGGIELVDCRLLTLERTDLVDYVTEQFLSLA